MAVGEVDGLVHCVHVAEVGGAGLITCVGHSDRQSHSSERARRGVFPEASSHGSSRRSGS